MEPRPWHDPKNGSFNSPQAKSYINKDLKAMYKGGKASGTGSPKPHVTTTSRPVAQAAGSRATAARPVSQFSNAGVRTFQDVTRPLRQGYASVAGFFQAVGGRPSNPCLTGAAYAREGCAAQGLQITNDVSGITDARRCRAGNPGNCVLAGAAMAVPGPIDNSGITAARTARATGGLSGDVVRLAEGNLTTSGDTVLGHYPGYIEKANARGASYFDIGVAWDSLSATQRTAANNHFLEVVAARGDRILLSTPKTQIREGSALADEIQYLTTNHGYRWVNQWSLRPGG